MNPGRLGMDESAMECVKCTSVPKEVRGVLQALRFESTRDEQEKALLLLQSLLGTFRV
jgi:hypothetical protein